MNFKTKLILFCTVIFGLNFFTQNIFAMQRSRGRENKGAGILPYAVMQDGEIYFLFNCEVRADNKLYWGAFVNKFDSRFDIDLKDTAISCFNDNMSSFISERLTKDQLDDNKRIRNLLTGYKLYFVKINLAQFTDLYLSNFAQILLKEPNTNFKGFALISVLDLKMGINSTKNRNLVNLDCKMAYFLNPDKSFSFENQIDLGGYLSTELSHPRNKGKVLEIIQNIIIEERQLVKR
ncbi:MAG: hypothetical protein WC436_01975 [Candidatus Babeliales bacterium]